VKYACRSLFALPATSACKLNIVTKGIGHKCLNDVEAFILIRLLGINFKISSSAEVFGHEGNFVLESGGLNPEIPLFFITFVSNQTNIFF